MTGNNFQNKGATLIEILLTIGLFGLIIGAVSNVFYSILQEQRKGLVSQEIFDSTSYNLEYVSRLLRMAQKDTAGSCISTDKNYEATRTGSGIKFLDYNGSCREFYLENNRIYQQIGEGLALPITSSKLKVDYLNFNILGDSQGDELQPKVTMFLEISRNSTKTEEQVQLKIQTTIAQRNLDL